MLNRLLRHVLTHILLGSGTTVHAYGKILLRQLSALHKILRLIRPSQLQTMASVSMSKALYLQILLTTVLKSGTWSALIGLQHTQSLTLHQRLCRMSFGSIFTISARIIPLQKMLSYQTQHTRLVTVPWHLRRVGLLLLQSRLVQQHVLAISGTTRKIHGKQTV